MRLASHRRRTVRASVTDTYTGPVTILQEVASGNGSSGSAIRETDTKNDLRGTTVDRRSVTAPETGRRVPLSDSPDRSQKRHFCADRRLDGPRPRTPLEPRESPLRRSAPIRVGDGSYSRRARAVRTKTFGNRGRRRSSTADEDAGRRARKMLRNTGRTPRSRVREDTRRRRRRRASMSSGRCDWFKDDFMCQTNARVIFNDCYNVCSIVFRHRLCEAGGSRYMSRMNLLKMLLVITRCLH
ncbi:serine/arginine repetitive matrix protein 2-like [Homarus americanus]|uniref:serine/arginine repetitive matrix protein 2-like n=1 Tax=Homarus americanus TaxID=6706 RepID=UPI001C45C861|nr:serine/arginine repetitive matrix protein 2-like [Homarus americanus]